MNGRLDTTFANDNASTAQHPLGDAIGFNAALREMNIYRIERGGGPRGPGGMGWDGSTPKEFNTFVHALTLMWLASLVTAFWYLYNPSTTAERSLSFIGLICTALSLSSAARHKKRLRLAEFSILTALTSAAGLWGTLAGEYFMDISLIDGAFGFSAIALITAWLMRSNMALIISCCGALIWVTLFSQVSAVNLIPLSTLPLLTGMQLITASQQSSRIATTTASFAAYLWIYLICMTHNSLGNISSLQIAGLITLIGIAHYRIGKCIANMNVEDAVLHIAIGWVVAIGGVMALQHFWHSPQAEIWQSLNSTATGNFAYRATVFIAITISGLAILWHGGLSLPAMLALSVIGFSVMSMTNHPDIFAYRFAQYTGQVPSPSIAFVIAGMIFATAVAMAINGMQRGKMIMSFAGLSLCAVEMQFIQNSSYVGPETLLIMSLSFLFSLCCLALLSTTSLRAIISPTPPETPTWPSKTHDASMGAPVGGAYFTRLPTR